MILLYFSCFYRNRKRLGHLNNISAESRTNTAVYPAAVYFINFYFISIFHVVVKNRVLYIVHAVQLSVPINQNLHNAEEFTFFQMSKLSHEVLKSFWKQASHTHSKQYNCHIRCLIPFFIFFSWLGHGVNLCQKHQIYIKKLFLIITQPPPRTDIVKMTPYFIFSLI